MDGGCSAQEPRDGPPIRFARSSMQLFDTTHLALERALSGASQRHAALSENIANVNTVGYRRKDVDFHSALQAAMPLGRDALAAAPMAAEIDNAAPMRADGNSVDVDAENANLAQNALEYEALAQVLRVRQDIIQIAMGVR